MWPHLRCFLLSLSFLGTLSAQTSTSQPNIGRLVLRGDPLSLDPQAAIDAESLPVVQALYDTLLEYHPLKSTPWELRPCMLASMPKKEVSADGRHSYLCELKRGIRFHDDPCFPDGKGREITAADVHYAFQRLCDGAVESMHFEDLAEIVEGMAEAREQAEMSEGAFPYDKIKVSGIEVLDAQRFRIRLKKPHPQIVYWLAMPWTTPVAREAAEFYRWNAEEDSRSRLQHPVGTGAFQLREHIPGKRIRLARFPGYSTTFPDDGNLFAELKSLAGKPLPLLDEIEVLISRNPQAVSSAFLKGKLDSMPLDREVRKEFFDENGKLKEKLRERGISISTVADANTFWITFNLKDPVIGKSKKLRQAIACAFDPSAFAQRFIDGPCTVATQLLPPSIFGHEPERKNPFGYNLEKAKQLLADAGYPGGRAADGEPLEIPVLAHEIPSVDGEEEFLIHTFETLGLRARVEIVDYSEGFERRESGEFQIGIGTGWGADYADPENFFSLFQSRKIPPTGFNVARYRNVEFDRLCNQMAVMENTPERLAIIRKLNALLAEDCPVAVTYHKQLQFITQPGFRRTNFAETFNAGWKFLAPRTER